MKPRLVIRAADVGLLLPAKATVVLPEQRVSRTMTGDNARMRRAFVRLRSMVKRAEYRAILAYWLLAALTLVWFPEAAHTSLGEPSHGNVALRALTVFIPILSLAPLGYLALRQPETAGIISGTVVAASGLVGLRVTDELTLRQSFCVGVVTAAVALSVFLAPEKPRRSRLQHQRYIEYLRLCYLTLGSVTVGYLAWENTAGKGVAPPLGSLDVGRSAVTWPASFLQLTIVVGGALVLIAYVIHRKLRTIEEWDPAS